MTHWELREARKAAGVKGKSHEDEPAIFAAYERLRRREEASVGKTKAARRSKARREGGQKQVVRRVPARLKPQPIPKGIKPFEHD
jgi:putative transposase